MEQMIVIICYVNDEGQVIEHFLGVVHVSNTSALTLKSALESLLSKYEFCQGYMDKAMMEKVICKVNIMVKK